MSARQTSQMGFQSARVRGRMVAVIAVVAMVSTGCATRLSQDEIRAAAGTTTVTEDSGSQDAQVGATGTGAADPATSGTATPGAGAVGGGSVGTATTESGSAGAGSTAAAGSKGSGSKGGAPAPGSTGAGAQAPAIANKSLIKVGNIGPYSGVLGGIFGDIPASLQVWAKWTNANGGLNGHPVQVITADTGGDPSKALTLAKNMVEGEGVIAFVNNFLLFEFESISNYAASKGVPLIGGDLSNPAWTTSPIAFPQGGSFEAQMKIGTQKLVEIGGPKIATLYCIEVAFVCKANNELIHKWAAKVGADIVYNAPVSLTAPSYTSTCINAKNSGASGIWILAEGASVARFVRDCAAQGYKPNFAMVGLASPAVPSEPNLAGAIIPSPVFPSVVSSTPATAAFHTALGKYASYLLGRLNGEISNAWTAGQLALAGAKYLSDKPTGTEWLKGLRELKKETLGGLTIPLTFTSGRYEAPLCVFFQGIENGRYTAPQGLKTSC
ncbi:ABC transporter substrate-binding protein [Sporichthya sp.]|uniref:ABC transporter substrate-binding protein n=1 Tax=Sporichthya sp. TaxID=65475 RepID=UPI00180D3989|nr:ABC transporter substrate-binding protein [Sporichthya sp.]MBA3741407.1 ABC transporter substrate-binding protein [Sporichthya sp.]